jgi:hypothetical protein
MARLSGRLRPPPPPRAPRAGDLDHGAHRAAGDDAGARGRGLDQHEAGAEVAQRVVRDRGARHRHGDQVLLGDLDPLSDRHRNLVTRLMCTTCSTNSLSCSKSLAKAVLLRIRP